MKTLHLVRHAKSSWDFPDLSDHERPLNDRGIRSCRVMGPALVEAGCSFDNVYSSSAKRAQDTIGQIAAHLPESPFEWQVDGDLYTFSSEDLLQWCQQGRHGFSDLTLIGHNPAITDFTNILSRGNIFNVPTCAYVQLQCDISDWSRLEAGCAQITRFIKPKMFLK